jgi:predicted regulator of Ras-like GTPase activity (Roadblock/LC7/MglB family)
MNILKFFKRKVKTAAAEAPAPAPVQKSSAERLHKTVMPNSTRASSLAGGAMSGSLMGGGYGGGVAVAEPPPPAAAPRTVSFGSATPASSLPPAVAMALEPRVERAIALSLVDVVENMPAGLVRELTAEDKTQRVLINAAELERGMANGRPTVLLGAVYQQLPEIFVRPVESGDTTKVQLPFQKVLEQFTALQVRGDQAREQAVPQVETPFLRVTLEDNSKFGIPMEPLETTAAPPVKMEPATAETLAAAEPEPAAAAIRLNIPSPSPAPASSSAPAPIPFRLTPAEAPSAAAASAAPAPANIDAAPARIPFKLSPNGTDAPASEKVPASHGPSVPTSSPAPAAPARIPFKLDTAKSGEPWITKESLGNDSTPAAAESAADAEPQQPTEQKISLALEPILENLTPFQLLGEPGEIPSIARVELPFSIVEPQLASGRVVITPAQFAEAMPEEYRHLFNADVPAATVQLPLQEVLKNLPATSLRIREDQVEQEKGVEFVTPFSATAEEDAKRFKVAAAPVAKQSPAAPKAEPEKTETTPEPIVDEAAAPAVEPEPQTEAAPAPEPAAEPSDAKAAMAELTALHGVRACALTFGDGLTLAGSLPEELDADGLCALAPSVMQRLQNHTAGTKLGGLRSMTLHTGEATLTFFMHDNLCLAAMHANGELAAEVRDRMARAVHELSEKYSNPA